jgi:hypothetical protein
MEFKTTNKMRIFKLNLSLKTSLTLSILLQFIAGQICDAQISKVMFKDTISFTNYHNRGEFYSRNFHSDSTNFKFNYYVRTGYQLVDSVNGIMLELNTEHLWFNKQHAVIKKMISKYDGYSGKTFEYYNNGKLKSEYFTQNGAISGQYSEFYENGTIQTVGYFNPETKPIVLNLKDEVTGQAVEMWLPEHLSVKSEWWYHYNQKGKITKKEYKRIKLQKLLIIKNGMNRYFSPCKSHKKSGTYSCPAFFFSACSIYSKAFMPVTSIPVMSR